MTTATAPVSREQYLADRMASGQTDEWYDQRRAGLPNAFLQVEEWIVEPWSLEEIEDPYVKAALEHLRWKLINELAEAYNEFKALAA